MTLTADTPSRLPDPADDSSLYSGVATKRALAWVIDVVVVAAFCLLALPFTAFTGVFFFPLLMIIVGFIYRWFTIANRSATWGMRLFAIELRDLDGARLTSGLALAHTAGYTFSVVTAPLQLISIAAMAFSPRGQGLSDFVLGTTAIHRVT